MAEIDSDATKSILADLERIGGRVARILEIKWDAVNDETLWSCNGCRQCGAVLSEGETGYVWGKPLKVDSTHCAVLTFCSSECVNEAMIDWAAELQEDVTVAWLTHD